MRKILFVLIACVTTLQAQDQDRDSIPDTLEQSLLWRFLPAFHLSAGECDGQPARFFANRSEPVVDSRNGTIYGMVIPYPGQPRSARIFVEVHFYHLWGNDCGRAGHTLDAEHVSALIVASSLDAPVEEWKALYWYAAAHENTVCDASHTARADRLQAETHGPAVYISAGKHASFLALELCSGGCGGDACLDPVAFTVADIHNLGSPEHLLNGSNWVASPLWQMSAKLRSDFPESVFSELDQAEIVFTNSPRRQLKAVIQAGGTTMNALSTAAVDANASADIAHAHTASALSTAKKNAGNSVRRARAAVSGYIRKLGL